MDLCVLCKKRSLLPALVPDSKSSGHTLIFSDLLSIRNRLSVVKFQQVVSYRVFPFPPKGSFGSQTLLFTALAGVLEPDEC